jgi:hypothetical protein
MVCLFSEIVILECPSRATSITFEGESSEELLAESADTDGGYYTFLLNL